MSAFAREPRASHCVTAAVRAAFAGSGPPGGAAAELLATGAALVDLTETTFDLQLPALQ